MPVNNARNARQGKAFVGDWILKTEHGLKVYTPESFADAFDLVKGEQQDAAAQAEKPQPEAEAA